MQDLSRIHGNVLFNSTVNYAFHYAEIKTNAFKYILLRIKIIRINQTLPDFPTIHLIAFYFPCFHWNRITHILGIYCD